MRKLFLLLLAFGLAAPVTATAQMDWLKERVNKNREYNLGAKPTVDTYPDSYHQLREDVGWFQVVGFEKGTSLTLKFGPPRNEVIVFERDPDVEESIDCDPAGPVFLRPGEVCAIMTRVDQREREYHLQVSWTYDEDKDIMVVKVSVKMQVIKLD